MDTLLAPPQLLPTVSAMDAHLVQTVLELNYSEGEGKNKERQMESFCLFKLGEECYISYTLHFMMYHHPW